MKQVVYVTSPESKEIHVWNLNKHGKLTLLQQLRLNNKVEPIQISFNGQYLYAGVRSDCAIITYRISNTGKLNQQAITYIPGIPTHIEVDKYNHWLFISSYHHNCLMVLPINQHGIAQTPIMIINDLNHPHSSGISLNNLYLFVPCLGEDYIRIYNINNGYLTESVSDRIITSPGSGPRHLVFAPNHNVFYCLNELNATINVYLTCKPYQQKQSCNILSTKSKNKSWAADIHITPDGCHLYASERSASIIRHFKVTNNGLKLIPMMSYPTEKQPRGFNIDKTGNFLIVAGQKSNHISIYKINKVTGSIQILDRYQVGNGPIWIITGLSIN